MKKIEINTSELSFHCLVCGTENVGKEGFKDVCDHLVYLGTNDGGPEYDKLKLHNDDNEENDPHEVIEKLDDSYTGFYCYHPSSRSIEVYLVYSFPLWLKNKKRIKQSVWVKDRNLKGFSLIVIDAFASITN